MVKECKNVLAGVAIMIISVKSLFWISIIANTGFFVALSIELLSGAED